MRVAVRRPFLYGAAFAFMLFGALARSFKDARLPVNRSNRFCLDLSGACAASNLGCQSPLPHSTLEVFNILFWLCGVIFAVPMIEE